MLESSVSAATMPCHPGASSPPGRRLLLWSSCSFRMEHASSEVADPSDSPQGSQSAAPTTPSSQETLVPARPRLGRDVQRAVRSSELADGAADVTTRSSSPVRVFASSLATCAPLAHAPRSQDRSSCRHSDVAVTYVGRWRKARRARAGFTARDGQFVLRDLKPGQDASSARHIGYAPLDTTIDVAAGDTLSLRLELALVTIQLPAVHALAQRCAHPGGIERRSECRARGPVRSSEAECRRNRLLATSYPFEVIIERKITKPEPSLEARFIAYDTVVRSSDRTWRYRARQHARHA